MKNVTYFVLLGLLIGLGVTLIWREALAVPVPCTTAWQYCEMNCGGVFSLDSCWESEGQTWCTFYCRFFDPFKHCGWTDPTYSICEGFPYR